MIVRPDNTHVLYLREAVHGFNSIRGGCKNPLTQTVYRAYQRGSHSEGGISYIIKKTTGPR